MSCDVIHILDKKVDKKWVSCTSLNKRQSNHKAQENTMMAQRDICIKGLVAAVNGFSVILFLAIERSLGLADEQV